MTESFYRLEWTDSKGGFRSESSRYIGRFGKKLETLRCEAELWVLDAQSGAKIEKIGGCERVESHRMDDKRIKWNWWYDKTAVGL